MVNCLSKKKTSVTGQHCEKVLKLPASGNQGKIKRNADRRSNVPCNNALEHMLSCMCVCTSWSVAANFPHLPDLAFCYFCPSDFPKKLL
jgi:hypothetical protein